MQAYTAWCLCFVHTINWLNCKDNDKERSKKRPLFPVYHLLTPYRWLLVTESDQMFVQHLHIKYYFYQRNEGSPSPTASLFEVPMVAEVKVNRGQRAARSAFSKSHRVVFPETERWIHLCCSSRCAFQIEVLFNYSKSAPSWCESGVSFCVTCDMFS